MNSIHIEGYKSIKEIDLTLRPINILIGANGAGKSNFLSFFDMLNSLYERNLAAFVSLNGGTDKFLHKGSKVTQTIKAMMRFNGNSYGFELKEGDHQFVFMHEWLGYTSKTGWINDKDDISTFRTEAEIKNYSGKKRGGYIQDYLETILKYHFHDTGKQSPFTQVSNIQNDIFYLYRSGKNLAAFLFAIRQQEPIIYQRMIKVIQSVAPYFSDFFFYPNENGDVRLLWRDRFSETVYGPSDFSDGTLRFIALTALFLQPNPAKLIVIDEPELGLHPVAIAKLAGLMKSAAAYGSQIIAATQSSDLISHFEPQDVITVSQVNGESRMERLDGESLSQWLEEYTLGELWKNNIIHGGQPK
ncbi:MAG: AAA family ATPase [Bacteroidaceae bacterium]|nr:AAA family ATPase [Bacteroidaceae bacterium]